MEQNLASFLDKQSTIALVGASNNPEKYGFKILADLTLAGYRIIPIHPKESRVQDLTTYPNLTDAVTKGVEIQVVLFVIPPHIALEVLQECLTLGLNKVWFQPGTADAEVLQFCEQHQFQYVHDACMMVERKK